MHLLCLTWPTQSFFSEKPHGSILFEKLWSPQSTFCSPKDPATRRVRSRWAGCASNARSGRPKLARCRSTVAVSSSLSSFPPNPCHHSYFFIEILIDMPQPTSDTKKPDPKRSVPTICCAKQQDFRPMTIACYAHPANTCMIKPRQIFYLHRDGTYSVLKDCFQLHRSTVEIYVDQVDPQNETTVTCNMSEFAVVVNDMSPLEPLLECVKCHSFVHAFCVAPFILQSYTCFKCTNECPKFPLYISPYLFTCPLSHWIQNSIDLLCHKYRCEHDDIDVPQVTVKVISTTQRSFDVLPKMSAVYGSAFPSSFSYRKKAIFAFQEQSDGIEVCFFGLFVDEYDDDSAKWSGEDALPNNPNRRCVNISYLDTVHYFEPPDLRRKVYYEIILSYLEFISKCGYKTACIWSCPPGSEDDYIFYAHPEEQQKRYPKPKNLRRWYVNLLDVAIERRIVTFYTDTAHHAINLRKFIHQFCYFEGDFWPRFIESTIDALFEELADNDGRLGEENALKFNELLHSRTWAELQRNKNSFFLVDLTNHDESSSYPIFDLCPTIPCPLFNGRDQFLTFCRNDIRCEFSDIRRARYSTQRMLKEILDSQKAELLKVWKGFEHACKCKNTSCTQEGCSKLKKLIEFSRNLPHWHPVSIMYSNRFKKKPSPENNPLAKISKCWLDRHAFLCSLKCDYCKSLIAESGGLQFGDSSAVSDDSPSSSGIPFEPSPLPTSPEQKKTMI